MGKNRGMNAGIDSGLDATLGIELQTLEPDRVVATMPITKGHLQPYGFLHGGATAALAEHVASFGANLNLKPGQAAFGLEIHTTHLRKKRDGTLIATATPVHRGRRIQVWRIEIEDEKGRRVAVAQCTLAVVPLDSDPPGA